MRTRRGFRQRLHDSIQIDGGDFVDVLYVLASLITTVVNAWPS